MDLAEFRKASHRLVAWAARSLVQPERYPMLARTQPAGQAVAWVEGKWIMPAVAPPQGAEDVMIYAGSTWVGIDGDGGSPDESRTGSSSGFHHESTDLCEHRRATSTERRDASHEAR